MTAQIIPIGRKSGPSTTNNPDRVSSLDIPPNPEYLARVSEMGKLDLLEEMIRYQQWRAQVGHLTEEMITKGFILFEALEKTAETQELRKLCSTYRRHLRAEYADRNKVG